MTEKTLSEKICEECGIEYEREVIDPLYKSMCNEGDPRCTQISKTIKKKLDFQNNNNNFVKLLCVHTDYITKNNIKIPCKTIWWILNKDAKNHNQLAPYDVDLCLIRLLIILKNKNNKYSSEDIEKIKNTIRQADWEV